MSEDMFVVTYVVGVALTRPPVVDEYRKVVLASTGDEVGDWQTACLIASQGAVMAVSSELESVEY